MSAVGRMRIGEVHALLRQEFPGIELSKIRYYEDKGLVRPSRSRKGYRLYSDNDVACLREALKLAEAFVPLRVVRQRLIDQGLLVDGPVPVSPRAAIGAPANVVSLPVPREPAPREPARVVPIAVVDSTNDVAAFGPTGARFSRDEFLSATGLNATRLADLESFGFVAPREVAGESSYDERDLAVARAAARLLARGVDVRHLQPLKRTVERQVDLLGDLTAPLRQGGAARVGLDCVEETRKVAAELAGLREALLDRATSEYLGR